jgi:hypothetical protein
MLLPALCQSDDACSATAAQGSIRTTWLAPGTTEPPEMSIPRAAGRHTIGARRPAPPDARRIPMRYVILIYGQETWMDGLSEEERAAHMARWGEYDEALRAAGIAVAGEALDRPATARTLRGRGGKPVVTDGPFAETREQLGGFIEIEAASMEEAVEWAARCPVLAHGTAEVRPVVDM